jgi:hypothetical protein
MPVAMAAVACLAGEAQARDTRRLTIELDWHHVPRQSDGNDPPISSQRALVSGAAVRYLRYKDGARLFAIEYDAGMVCTTTVEKRATASLTCGTLSGYFSLIQFPGEQTKVEWVFDADAKPAAERESEPTPKVKVRL